MSVQTRHTGGLIMFAHTIVFIILAVLSGTAIHAMSSPVSKAPTEQVDDQATDDHQPD